MAIEDLKNEENLEEFVDADGSFIDGDRNPVNDKEIETGPVQKDFKDNSDYEKGMSTTTDRATRYRQNIPWFAVYSYRSASGRGMPVNENKRIYTKKEIEEKIKEDLVKKSKHDGDVWEKEYNSKFEKLIDNLSDNDYTEEQLKKIKQLVLDKIKNKNG